jgi:hypothetical protein
MSADFSMLQAAQWRTLQFDKSIFSLGGMLSEDERKCLYYLAREYYTGSGCVVDAGSFAGASAHCVALGLRDNPKASSFKQPAIHCFDRFLLDSDFMREFLHQSCGVLKPLNTTFFDVFQKNTAPIADMIEVHPGDFMKMVWPGDAIEILFVDICKTAELNSHVLREFFSALQPGRSIVIQQDYHHPYLPWIHISMEFLADYFEPLEVAVGDSRLFALVKPIPGPVLEQCAAYAFSFDEQLGLMERAIDRVRAEDRACVSLAKVILLWQNGKKTEARSEVKKVQKLFNADGLPPLWSTYYDQVASIVK